ncbi:hypothetical protein LSAT2_002673 [Lamellibrachia satsuma]|nr:hypothetical protein LSAT2_002673 [Lamellibrachia satsuma]
MFLTFIPVGCTIVVALVLAVPISMVVIGSIYLGQCPREHYIPIYLIVAGAFGILKNLSNIVQRVVARIKNDDNVTKSNPFDGILNCFLLAWFIAGNVWIYRIYNDFDSSDEKSSRYCQPTLYWFAFWVTTASYIFSLSLCCCICCSGLLAACCTNNSSN